MLRNAGYIVAGVAATGEEALRIAVEKMPDLITNALKYAFPAGFEREAMLRISMSEDGGGNVELIVEDNGIGLPEGIAPGATSSLGLYIVPLPACQLNSAIALDRDNGTKYTLKFKKK